jgi:hypothetical protein
MGTPHGSFCAHSGLTHRRPTYAGGSRPDDRGPDPGENTMKTTRTAALALAAALGLSACGSSGDEAGSSSRTSSSSSSSTTQGSGAKAGATVDGAALGKRIADAMAKAGSGAMTMDLGDQGKASGTFSMAGDTMDQQMTMDFQGQSLEVVSVDGIIYLKGFPGGSKPWIRIDPKGDDPMSQMFGQMVGKAGANDPRQIAKALEGAKATVVSESAEGSVYDVTIDPDKLISGAQTSAPAVDQVTARYTLDSQDRPTKMTLDVEGQTVTITFSDWGVATKITAPPASQIGTFQLPSS